MKNNSKIAFLTDNELLDLYKKEKQKDVYSELYKRHLPLVYGLCLKYLGYKDEAQDAVVLIYQRSSDSVLAYDIQNYYAWLYSFTKNFCLSKIKNENRIVFVNIDNTGIDDEEPFTLLDKEITLEEEKVLNECLNKLRNEQQKTIRLFYYDNKSYADIAEITGYTLDKVKKYILKGKRTLKGCCERLQKK